MTAHRRYFVDTLAAVSAIVDRYEPPSEDEWNRVASLLSVAASNAMDEARRLERERSRKVCRHYAYQTTPGDATRSGPVCELGVQIREHVGGPSIGWMARIPCVWTTLSNNVVACDRADLLPAQELAQIRTKPGGSP